MIAYKVLTADLRPPLQGGEPYIIGKRYICEEFDDRLIDCSRGYYATDTVEGLLYINLHNGKVPYLCEVEGKNVSIDRFKQRWERLTIVRMLEEQEVRKLAKKTSLLRGYNIELALYPVNPLLLPPPSINDRHIISLKEWASVRASVGASVRASVGASVWASVRASVRASVWDSVRASVWDSVWDSVRASVWDSVWASVRASVGASVGASVWDSVWDSVGAYVSSLFFNIYPGGNPYQSSIDLWNCGLIPTFDGKIWRLHGEENADILYEGKI